MLAPTKASVRKKTPELAEASIVAVTAFDVWMPAATVLSFPVIGVIGALPFLPGPTPADLLPGGLGAWGPEGLGLPNKQDKAVFIVAPATVPPPSSYHPPLPPGSCHHSLSNSFRTKTRDPEDLGGALRECLLCSNDQFLVTNWSNSPS